mmetsp:Transcript_15275/g.22387  ORF Transcript_15275/g.22387 Transcript_15275/m.22387 type:complete len:85 (+) Transcript_15275:52-306(+)
MVSRKVGPAVYLELSLCNVQTRRKDDISFDSDRCLFHLPIERRVSNDSCAIPNFSAELVKTSDAPHNASFLHKRELAYVTKWNS